MGTQRAIPKASTKAPIDATQMIPPRNRRKLVWDESSTLVSDPVTGETLPR